MTSFLLSSNSKKFFIFLLITLGIFALIFFRVDFFSMIQILLNVNVFMLGIAFILTLFTTLLLSKRWQIILHASMIDITFKESFTIIMGTYPFAAIMPSVSSDLIRAIPLRDRYRMSKIIGSCISERSFDFLLLVFISGLGMILMNSWHYLNIVVISFLLIISFYTIIRFRLNLPVNERWKGRFSNVLNSLRLVVNDRYTILRVIFSSMCIWVVSIFQISLFFNAVNVYVPLIAICAFIPLAIFIGQIPISLGGAGTRDAAIILLFAEYGSNSQLLAVGMLFSIFRCWLPAMIGVPFMEKMSITNILDKRDPE